MSAVLKTKDPKQIRFLLPKGTTVSSSALPQTQGAGQGQATTQSQKKADETAAAAAASAAAGAGASSHHASTTVPDIQATLSALGVQSDGILYMVFATDDAGEKFEEVAVPDFDPLVAADSPQTAP